MADRTYAFPGGDNGDYRAHGGALVHRGAVLGEGVELEPGALIGDHVVLGDGVRVGAGAVLRGPTEIGRECWIHPLAVLGDAPQDTGYRGEPTRLVIGERNVFREHVTVHRGTVKGGGLTRIGNDNFFMVGVHVAHDCALEDHIVLSNGVLIGGHCHIHSHVNMSGGTALVQFTTVGRLSFVGGLSGSNRDLEPFLAHDGVPTRPRSLNLVGLRRGGFRRDTIHRLKEAFHLLFPHDRPNPTLERVEAARQELLGREAMCEEVEELLEFMSRSRRARFGRMLQGR